MLSKALRLGAMVGIMALVAATNVFAQSQCTSRTASEGPGNFVVNVTQTTANGRTVYQYSLQNAPGKTANPNKFFVWVKQGLNLEVPANTFECIGDCSLSYLTPHQTAGSNSPPAEAWRVAHHQDGVGSPAVSINKQFKFTVNDRFKPEESLTTVLLGVSNTYEHCGPIYGPTNPLPPGFEGSPLVTTTALLTFANGCSYNATVGITDNIIRSMTPSPDTPFATVFPFEACTADNNTDCEGDLNLVFCPPGEVGRPPLQSTPGGTCYYKNIKYSC